MYQGDQLERKDNLSCKTAKVLTQTKLTSLYGNFSGANNNSFKSSVTSKGNSSDDCIDVEKAPSYHIHSRGTSTFIKVEEEKTHGSSLGSKRAHMEIRSQRNEVTMSPSCNEEANNDVSGNGFVTARTKLVIILLVALVDLRFMLVLRSYTESDYFLYFFM